MEENRFSYFSLKICHFPVFHGIENVALVFFRLQRKKKNWYDNYEKINTDMTGDTMQSKAIVLTEVISNQKILMIKANVFFGQSNSTKFKSITRIKKYLKQKRKFDLI